MMDIKELTQEMHHFVRSQGWYAENSPRPQTLRNLAISLALEAGEVLEHFQWSNEASDPDELGDELADVALYLLQLASLAGIDLEDAILLKLKRNYGRRWEEK
jgi:NTP pyrophosphatase (non-canonical NTP hydrolase)